MSDNTQEQAVQRGIPEGKTFTSREDAIAFLQSIPEPMTIIIITPPPH